MNKENTTKIPLIFATDDGYVPFLSVALKSIIENANKDYFYPVYILTSGLSSENISKLKELENENFSIESVDVTKNLNELKSSLHLRDYYSKAIYYRIFIPTLFRQYEKAIYLDCDIVVTDDISKMYFVDLKDNLLGAITEEVMTNVDVFGRYSEEALGVERNNYFNSGVLLMNLELMRKEKIEEQFFALLEKFKFIVAPDQDYLNVVCKDRVTYLDKGWNRTPINDKTFNDNNLHLIHYKMAWKPWHYDDVLYGDIFWKYANSTNFIDKIVYIKENYSSSDVQNDKDSYDKLVQTALKDINDEGNYFKTISKNK